MGVSDARRDVVAEVARAVEDERLWEPGATVVAAVSGGADSLCLLGALLDLRERHAVRAPGDLVVVTLDHGLRGAAGAEDAQWVAELAASLGLRCLSDRVDTRALAQRERLSIEDAARRLRYRFLRQIAREVGAARICVGHTQDDQAETVLIHLLRGSGLAGLVGMRPLQGDIARPLLTITRAQTEAYCAARGWQPRVDETNRDERYLRNRVRRHLLPALETYNPQIRQAVARAAATLADDEALLAAATDAAWTEVVVGEAPRRVALSLEALSTQSRALRRRLIRRAAERVRPHAHATVENDEALPPLESRHVNLIERLAMTGSTGTTLTLPAGLRAARSYTELRVSYAARRQSARAPHEIISGEWLVWPLTPPGMVEATETGWRVRAAVTETTPGMEGDVLPEPPRLPPLSHAGTAAAVHRGEWRVYADAEATGERLRVRAWRPGDRFRPLGMTHAKKVQDVFADAKVPRELRRRLPLVCTGEGAEERIVWVVGVRIGDEFKLTDKTRRTLVLQAEPLDRRDGESWSADALPRPGDHQSDHNENAEEDDDHER
ncbi:MAG TPA: tRNA lysidine(34) synthetase TilS [Ktedonobacterales bacterium]|nr:tRNA lysidine(34) synthetase TilS [Ktedonobacterales bacterium]